MIEESSNGGCVTAESVTMRKMKEVQSERERRRIETAVEGLRGAAAGHEPVRARAFTRF